jgi:preprotein translocase subunit SecF
MAAGFAQWGNDLYTGRKSYDIVGKRRTWYGIAIGLVLVSAALLLVKGLNPGIEFRGGSQFTVSGVATLEQQPAIDAVEEVSPEEEARVSTVGGSAVRVQTAQLSNEEVEQVRAGLAAAYDVSEDEVTSSFVGPSWGADVSSKAITGLVVFLGLVALVMTLYFRAWRMAAAALLALAHDLVVTVGIYALVGWEVTPATVIGFLTILGYSIYDTVVVFDKVRENTAGILDQSRYTYEEQANLAVNQTLVRSINTSVVAVLPVSAILFVGAFLLGAGTLRDIALALFVGMVVGTFSSIFLATPLEVTLRNREARIAEHTARVLAARGERPAPAAGSADTAGEAVTAGAATATSAASPHSAPHLVPGHHLGTAAQPKRRRSGRR